MKKLVIILLILCVAGAAVWFFFFRNKEKLTDGYEFVTIQKGNIVNTVSATGELEPIGTVEIGTQVSGIVDKVLVDFNNHVKKGQLLAVLDTTVLSTHRKDAKNTVDKTKAQYDLEKIQFEAEKSLFERGLSSEFKLDQARTTMEGARATYSSALISLERAEQNLAYALITSPIDGMVIDRQIEPGQTVAASFSSPTLFVIAEDLARMRILAQVDESDIGLLDTGMTISFEVPAYPDSSFTGKVVQIRLQPQVVSNVVNYTVVCESENKNNLLMPGMTATVDFLIDEKIDVLTVPNTVLSFQPPQEVLTAMRERMSRNRSDSTRQPRPADSTARDSSTASVNSPSSTTPSAGGAGLSRAMSSDMAILWTLNDKNELTPHFARKGVSDGKNTEIIDMRGELKEGMQIVSKMPKTGSSSNNLLMGGPGPGPMRMR